VHPEFTVKDKFQMKRPDVQTGQLLIDANTICCKHNQVNIYIQQLFAWFFTANKRDQCAALLIGFADLPFAVDGKNVWHLAPGFSQWQPAQWSIRRIVSSFVKGGIRYFNL
jgi:hypothetical protein